MGMAAMVMWPGPFEQTFILLSHGGSTWSLALTGLVVSKEKTFENVNLSDFALTFDIHIGSCPHLVNCSYQL